MKKNLKLKERLGAFFLALLFVLQAVLSLLPVASGSVVHAAVNSIGTWKDDYWEDGQKLRSKTIRTSLKHGDKVTLKNRR